MRRTVGRLVAALLGAFALMIALALREPAPLVTTYEVVPPGEADLALDLVRRATAVIEERAQPDRFFKRDAHTQPHGCVIAWLDVDPDLPDPYRQGIFSRPGRRYKAWARFSNGTNAVDTTPDARGMAIKVMGVQGPKVLDRSIDPERKTQDFVMIDYHTFFVRNVQEYAEFFGYQSAGRPKRFFLGWAPWRWRLHGLYHAWRMENQDVPSPLAARYYSMSAYRLGPRNVKFSAAPCRPWSTSARRGRGPHYLREALVDDLRSTEGCFDLLVQLQDPTKNMPIEDPSIEWRETDSHFVPVGRLTIPRQEFSSDVQNRFCESLAFSPWHTLPAHQPVGGLNRVRRAVYEAVSQRRHARNGTPRGEPRGWCLDLGGTRCEPPRELHPL